MIEISRASHPPPHSLYTHVAQTCKTVIYTYFYPSVSPGIPLPSCPLPPLVQLVSNSGVATRGLRGQISPVKCIAPPACPPPHIEWNHEKMAFSCTKWWSKPMTFWGSCPLKMFCPTFAPWWEKAGYATGIKWCCGVTDVLYEPMNLR